MNEMKRSQSNRHHTVPSPIFPTFPVLREIELRTDINDHHNRHQFSTDRFDDQKILSETDESVPSPDTITSKPYDYGFTLCDKLKMSFSDMQSMKERFEERRRQFPLKKKSIDQKSIVIDKLGTRRNLNESDGNKFKAHLIRTSSKDSLDDNIEESNQKKSSQENISKVPEDFKPERFSTPLIRTKRTVSDPTDQSYIMNPKRLADQEQHRQPTESIKMFGSKSKVYDEWLTKLKEINDMSRSTIDRIKRLENDLATLQGSNSKSSNAKTSPWIMADNKSKDQLPSPQSSSSSSSSLASGSTVKASKPQYVSRIPVNSNQSLQQPLQQFSANNNHRATNLIKQTVDKSFNTEIDLEFMNRLIKYWNSRTSNEPFPDDPQRFLREKQKDNIASRRLTTTICRSVRIQTDSEPVKSFEDKGVLTDEYFDEKWNPLEDYFHEPVSLFFETQQQVPPNPIKEMPFVKKINTFYVNSDTDKSDKVRIQNEFQKRSTPEPIVEMYSDNEDYGFDDFEKNIFNEISRRAILRSKNLSKSQSELNKRQQEERSSPMRSTMRNSSTQTLDRDNQEESLERIRRSSPSLLASNIDNDSIQRDSDRDKQTNPMTMISGSEADIFEPKLHSISKIWIDRPKEQREIYMKTDICKDGQVKRMTEIRNKKPNEEMIRIENECFPPDHHREWVDQNSIDNRETGAQPMKILKPEGHKETNRHREKELLSRTQSAFDLFEDDIINANQNEYLFGKAFSSLDISDSKSPISEGYYSEHLDSLNRNLSPTTNNQSYPLITRQFSVQKNKDNDKIQPKIFSKAYNNEGKENLWTLNNEMIIENVGNEMNITTRSISRRNQSKSLQAVNNRNETIQDREIDENNGLIDPRNVSDFVPQQHYNHHNETDRNYPKMNQNTLMATSNHNDFSNGCKFSFICNYDRGASLVLHADIQLSNYKMLPMYETNL